MTFSMVQIGVNIPALVSWARDGKIPLADRDYALHSALRLAFGQFAPQPFESFESEGNRLKILGYADATKEEMLDQMRQSAEPSLTQVFDEDSIFVKPMPDSWSEGKVFRFRLKTCPVIRFRNEEGRVVEKDAFLATVEGNSAEMTRESVYLDWVSSHFHKHDAADVLNIGIHQSMLKQTFRRNRNRVPRKITRPEIIVEGILKIKDSEAFSHVLRKGIGRHKAFGFGTLILRPAETR